MPTFYDLQKFAATGIASADMTAYDKARALAAFGGGKTQTLTDVPPLSFKANGTPLISWSMLGNGSQTGTPTPDAPIMPTFCGVRTGNLFDSAVYELVPVSASAQRKGTNLGVLPQGTYTFNAVSATLATPIYRTIKNGSTYTFEAINALPYTFTADGVSEQIIRTSGTQGNTWADSGYSSIMLNLGSTTLPYEPYGWAEKITCAEQTVPVYLGQTQTVRRIKKLVLTGDETFGYANSCFTYTFDGKPTSVQPTKTVIFSNAYKGVKPMYRDRLINYQCCITINFNQIAIRDNNYTTTDDFKSFLADQYAAGTPVVVWYVLAEPETGIVNEPLAKIGDYADELHSEDAGVSIPTVKGQNTLTVDTELQPSSMTITYKS